jgi:hypothetical protein
VSLSWIGTGEAGIKAWVVTAGAKEEPERRHPRLRFMRTPSPGTSRLYGRYSARY